MQNQNNEKKQDVRWMSPDSQWSSYKPEHTCDFPSGLITDYIKLVDQMRDSANKNK